MNSELREKISSLIFIESGLSQDGSRYVADRILALVEQHYAPPAPATEMGKLPEGVKIRKVGRYYCIYSGPYFYTGSTSHPWISGHASMGEACYSTYNLALAAALKAPPVPNDPHYMIPKVYPPGTSAIKPLPIETKQPAPSNDDKPVTYADMRRLADFYARQDYGLIEAIYEVFKEPA